MTRSRKVRRPEVGPSKAKAPTPSRARRPFSVFSLLFSAVRFAFAFRREGQRQPRSLDALKPQGDGGRAAETKALGKDANAPHEIPARGWWQVAKRTARKFSENELLSEAASVTFYALLSLFPAITAIVSIYGLFTDRSTIEGQLANASSLVPSGGMDIIREQVHRLTQSPASGLGVGAVIGLLTAMWSANAGTKAMFSALNDVYGEHEERGFVKVTAISLAFTVGGVALVLLGIGLIALLPLLFGSIGLGGVFDVVARIARWPVIVLIMVAALAMLYRFGPSRHLAKWQWVTWGGTIGAVSWIGLTIGFSWYVAHFGSYNKTYGSLGAIIGFMTWIWLSTTVLLLGAQINAELETQTESDSTVGAGKPLGSRGAASANTVAS